MEGQGGQRAASAPQGRPGHPPAPARPAAPQNKVDLVTEASALNQNETIQRFIQGTIAEAAPVVPISAQLKYNVDAVCEYLVKKIPVPVRDFVSPPQVRGGGSSGWGGAAARPRGVTRGQCSACCVGRCLLRPIHVHPRRPLPLPPDDCHPLL